MSTQWLYLVMDSDFMTLDVFGLFTMHLLSSYWAPWLHHKENAWIDYTFTYLAYCVQMI